MNKSISQIHFGLIKTSTATFAALAAIIGCSKENEEIKTASPQGDFTIEAEFADNSGDTKTTLDGQDILWCPGDKIMVYQGTLASGTFTSTISENSKKSSFTGSLTVIIGEQEDNPGQKDFWGVYPSSAASGCDGTSVTLDVSAEQQAVEDSFAGGVFPSVAKSTGYAMAFYNVCGGIKFTVGQSGIRKVVLRGADGETLAGRVKVSFTGGYPVVSSVVSGIDSVVVNAPDAGCFSVGKEYFIVALPSELPDGFNLTYANEYGSTKFATSSAVSIKRKTFAVLDRKDRCGILFRDKEAKAACVEKFDMSGDGEVSFEEAEVATTLNGLFENHDKVQYFPELQYFTSVRDLEGCFSDCVNLREQEIPSFITALGEKSFYGCTSLSSIEIPSSVKTIGSEAFRNCTSLSSITFNEGLESLDARAFYNIGAAELTLPSSLKSIGNRTFGNETTCIIMKGTVPPTLAAVSFGTGTVFYVPDEALSAYKSVEGWQEFEEYIFPISEYKGKDLSAKGTANCYVVDAAGSYKFKGTVKGGSTESVGTPASAEVLWESFGTGTTPSVGDIVKNASYSDGYVRFSTPSTLNNGNAVIAVKDASGNILWSWHIWVCKDFDPDASAQVYKNNAGTMMDRNLGATSATPGDVHALGLLYQWGRKDPFLSSSSISSNSIAASTITWPGTVSSSSSTGTNAYAVAHPTTFITYNKSNYDWYYTGSSSTDNTRWQTSDKDKGMYDPCPAGWRVPDGGSSGVWSTAFGSSSYYENGPWDSTNKGMNFGSGNGKSSSMQLGSASTIWYSAAGYRYYDDGTLYYVGNIGHYWSSTPYGYYAYLLDFNYDGCVSPSYDCYRACGRSVRCLSESE